MKQLIHHFIGLDRRKKYLTVFCIAAVLVVGFCLVTYIVDALQEHYLFQKYAANPEWKHVTDQMEVNKKDLANSSDKYKRFAATMDMGLQWFNLREFKFAAKWWERALDIESKSMIGWVNLGNAYRELKKFSRAETAYRKSMKLAREGEVDACLALGEMYRFYDKEQSDKAPGLYSECLKKHKNSPDLIARLADYYRDMGDRQNAILYFEKLFSIEPTQEVSEELKNLRSMAP